MYLQGMDIKAKLFRLFLKFIEDLLSFAICDNFYLKHITNQPTN